MKMKKICSALFCALLLILALVSLSLTAFAADPLEYALKMNFDPTVCSVSYSADGATPVNMVAGNEYKIAHGANLKIKVTPNPGYKLIEVKNEATGINMVPNAGQTEFEIDRFNAAASFTVSCAVRTFDVTFLPVEGKDVVDYLYTGTTPVTYTFKEQTELAIATKEGYKFTAWEVLDSDGTVISTVIADGEGKYILNLGAAIPKGSDESGRISVRPHFDPIQYTVNRFDYVYDENSPTGSYKLGSVTFLADMNKEVSGKDGPEGIYPGYYFIETDGTYFTSTKVNIYDPEVDDISKGNNVYRFYLPIKYTLVINAGGGSFLPDEVLPGTHVFDLDTRIPTPTRRGYTFAGWRITVTPNGPADNLLIEYNDQDLILSAKDPRLAGANGSEIKLEAVWSVNQYKITYTLNGGQSAIALPEYYSYDTDLIIPDPTRRGYTFVGWRLNGAEPVKGLKLLKETYESDLSLVAEWRANTYTVTLNGMGATNGFTEGLVATFDKAPTVADMVLPVRSQYRFLGYFTAEQDGIQYTDENGVFIKSWDLTENTILYAHWELLPVLTVDDELLKIDYKNERFDFPYGSYTVRFEGGEKSFTLGGGSGDNRIPDHFFGKTLTVIVHADGLTYSDYTTTIRLAARPAEPSSDQYTIVDTGEGKLNIQLSGSAIYEYALALSDSPDQLLFPWQDSPTFEGLKEGETYYLFIRVKASEYAPKSTTVMLDLVTATQVDLTILIISLSVVALCQLIAIILILWARAQRKREARASVSLLPMLLTTLHFLPKNGDLVALILGGVVILLQIILTYLILTSDLVRRDRDGDEEDGEEVFLELEEGAYPADGESDAAEVVYVSDDGDEQVLEASEQSYEGTSVYAEEPSYSEQDGVSAPIAEDESMIPYEETDEEPYLLSVPTVEEPEQSPEEPGEEGTEPRW